MSGKKNDILDPLDSLINEGERESVSKIITLLEGNRPKIKVDRVYQKSLKKTLLTQNKSSFSFSLDFPWFSIMTSMGALMTCFIAAFGLYNLWIGSTPMKNNRMPIPNPATMMYSEEKAEKFAPDASIIEDMSGQARENNEHSNAIASMSARAFKAEKSDIDQEIADIENEILDQESLDASPSPLIQQQDAIPSIATRSSPEKSVGVDEMSPTILKISPQMALSQSMQSTPKLVYPSTMKIYGKLTPWSQEEIMNRSGSGLIIKESSTEKISLLENRSKILAGGKKILSYSIVYTPRTKISRDPSELYYLIPTIEYILEGGEKIIVPLIRGYK